MPRRGRSISITVIVTDVGGQVGIGLTYASGGCLERGDGLDIDIDADQSAATGDDWGVDTKLHFAFRPAHPVEVGWNEDVSSRCVRDARMQGRPRSCARQRIRDRYSHGSQLQRDAELGRPSRGSYFFAVELQARESGSTTGAATGAGAAPPARPTPGPRGRTWQGHPGFPSRIRFTGRSVKHAPAWREPLQDAPPAGLTTCRERRVLVKGGLAVRASERGLAFQTNPGASQWPSGIRVSHVGYTSRPGNVPMSKAL